MPFDDLTNRINVLLNRRIYLFFSKIVELFDQVLLVYWNKIFLSFLTSLAECSPG